jgi:hypothetical protein
MPKSFSNGGLHVRVRPRSDDFFAREVQIDAHSKRSEAISACYVVNVYAASHDISKKPLKLCCLLSNAALQHLRTGYVA